MDIDETYTNAKQIDTHNYSTQNYSVILSVDTSGVEETIAETYFKIEGAPSAPSLNSPAHGEDVKTLTPALSVNNASDPNNDGLSYEFELYSDNNLINLVTISGITSLTLTTALSDNTAYTWRVRAYDGDLYGERMETATFTIHLPVTNITATIDFNPDTLNKKSCGKWVTVHIELHSGYNVSDIIISSILLEGKKL